MAYLDEDTERLQDLFGHVPLAVAALLQDAHKVLQQVVLQEVVQETRLMLVSPDHELGDAAQGLHQGISISICDHRIVQQHAPQVPAGKWDCYQEGAHVSFGAVWPSVATV